MSSMTSREATISACLALICVASDITMSPLFALDWKPLSLTRVWALVFLDFFGSPVTAVKKSRVSLVRSSDFAAVINALALAPTETREHSINSFLSNVEPSQGFFSSIGSILLDRNPTDTADKIPCSTKERIVSINSEVPCLANLSFPVNCPPTTRTLSHVPIGWELLCWYSAIGFFLKCDKIQF